MKRLFEKLKLMFARQPRLQQPVVSSSCGCVISWGVGFYDVKEGKDITHNVTNIFIDSFSSMVRVTIEKGLKVYTVNFSMEHAQEIGFINIKALSNYC